jgi:ParB family chromosome partitioning protein
MDDDEAVIAMVDSNIQRDALLPSEKAYAYKMRMDAMRHQGKRTDSTSRPLVEKSSADQTGSLFGESGRQVQRFIRLTELIPELLALVDTKKIGVRPGIDLSYLEKEQQELLYRVLTDQNIYPKGSQTKQLRSLATDDQFTPENILRVLVPEKEESAPAKRNILLSESVIGHYFDASYSEEQILEIIEQQLSRWAAQNVKTP